MPRLHTILAALTAAAAVQIAPVGADLAGSVASAANLPGLAATLDSAYTADAAFIRRSKLKKKRTTGYKVVIVTEEAPGDTPIAEIDAGFPTVGGNGGSIPDQALTTPNRHRKHFKGMLQQWPATYSITVTLDDGSAVTAPIRGLDPSLPGSESDVVLDGGFKAKLRIAGDLQVKVVVFNEDRLWDPTSVVGVRVGDDTDYLDIPHQKTVARWVKSIPASDVPDDFGDGSSYTIDVVARDEAGNELDHSIRGEVVGEIPSDDPILESARLKKTADGNVRVITHTEGFDGTGNSVQTYLTDDAGNVLVSSLDDMPARVARLYEDRTLTFDDPSLAADEVYSLVIDLKDSTGASLGSADVEVVVQGLQAGDTTDSTSDATLASSATLSASATLAASTPATATTTTTTSTGATTTDEDENPEGVPFTIEVNGETVAGVAAIAQIDATNFALGVGVSTDLGAWVDVQVTALSGAASIPEELSIAPVNEFKKWVSVGGGGLGTLDDGGTPVLSQVLMNEDGEEEDIVLASGGLWDWAKRRYKKRPGAPKGRVRSPKVNPSWDW